MKTPTLKTAHTTPSSTGEPPYLNLTFPCWKMPVTIPKWKTSQKSKTLLLMPWKPESDLLLSDMCRPTWYNMWCVSADRQVKSTLRFLERTQVGCCRLPRQPRRSETGFKWASCWCKRPVTWVKQQWGMHCNNTGLTVRTGKPWWRVTHPSSNCRSFSFKVENSLCVKSVSDNLVYNRADVFLSCAESLPCKCILYKKLGMTSVCT